MARIRSIQENLQGPIERNENLIDHYLFVTLVWGSVIGAIALFVWMFQAGAWSERSWPSVSSTVSTGQFWTRAQPVQPTPPAVSIPPAPAPAPAVPPQVTVNVDRIQVDATVQNVTAPPAVPAPSRELTPEEKANQFWDRALRRDP